MRIKETLMALFTTLRLEIKSKQLSKPAKQSRSTHALLVKVRIFRHCIAILNKPLHTP